MIKIMVGQSEAGLKEAIGKILQEHGYTFFDRGKELEIIQNPDANPYLGLKKIVLQLEKFLYSEKKEGLYRSLLAILEKPIIESVLERTAGNQLKAAQLLGLNRNTIRTKIKRLGIDPGVYKE